MIGDEGTGWEIELEMKTTLASLRCRSFYFPRRYLSSSFSRGSRVTLTILVPRRLDNRAFRFPKRPARSRMPFVFGQFGQFIIIAGVSHDVTVGSLTQNVGVGWLN